MNIDKLISIADAYFNTENEQSKACGVYHQAWLLDNDNAYVNQQLGICLENGLGIEKDIDQAKNYYQKAGESGMATACWNLAKIYEEEKNEECVKWFKKAHELGDRYAAFYLYVLYSMGEAVKADEQEAEKWLRCSCEESNEMAFYEMAQMALIEGTSDSDKKKYIEYLTKSADLGYLDACEDLVEYYKKNSQRITDEVVNYARKCAELGNPKVLFDIGCDYESGSNYADKDDALALKYYEEAANFGSSDACLSCAVCYKHGIGCEKNITTAIDWYAKALMFNISCTGNIFDLLEAEYDENTANEKFVNLLRECSEKGSAAAMFGMYRYLYIKKGDEKETLSWLTKATLEGYPNALYISGLIRDTHVFDSVEVNEEEAYHYFMAAYKAGCMEAVNEIGIYYLYGKFVKRDIDVAIEWFEAGAQADLSFSCRMLGDIYYNPEFRRCDWPKGFEYFEKGHKKHDGEHSAYCTRRLAEAYCYGFGVKKDLQKALELAIEAKQANAEHADETLLEIQNKINKKAENNDPQTEPVS